jgi:hypothetical protein
MYPKHATKRIAPGGIEVVNGREFAQVASATEEGEGVRKYTDAQQVGQGTRCRSACQNGTRRLCRPQVWCCRRRRDGGGCGSMTKHTCCSQFGKLPDFTQAEVRLWKR